VPVAPVIVYQIPHGFQTKFPPACVRRASAVLELLKKEVELCRLQADIGKQVEEKISKDQRRYFLQVPAA